MDETFYQTKLPILFFFLFFLFDITSNVLYSQRKSNISQYMDDGGISTIRNSITTDIISIAIGDYAIQYSRIFGKQFALEVGMGVLGPNYKGGLLFPIEDWVNDGDTKYGFSFLIRPKYYLREQFDSPSIGAILRLRHYGNDTRYAFGVSIERQWTLWNRFLVGIGLETGGEYENFPEEEGYDSDIILVPLDEPKIHLLLNVFLKVGFLF